MATAEECKNCVSMPDMERGPVTFVVRPQNAPHNDVVFTCVRHLALTIQAYSRQGYPCLVEAVRFDSDE